MFIHCLLKANWKSGRFQGHEVPRGSFISSPERIAEEISSTRQKVRTALKHLESTGEILTKSTNKFTLITIVNYAKYQDSRETANHQLTINQPSTNHQLTTIEQRNKETKKQCISYSSDFEDFWRMYPKHQPSKSKAFESFKKAIKKTDLDTMLNAISEQRRSEQWKDERYIPMATTWLNQERWEYDTKVAQTGYRPNCSNDLMDII